MCPTTGRTSGNISAKPKLKLRRYVTDITPNTIYNIVRNDNLFFIQSLYYERSLYEALGYIFVRSS